MASTGGHNESVLMSNNLAVATLKKFISSVCHLTLMPNGNILRKATGFLAKFSIGGDNTMMVVVVTTNHFVSRKDEASNVEATFEYEGQNEIKAIQLNPEIFFKTDKDHDYTFVGISPQDIDDLQVGFDVTPVKLEKTKFCVDADDIVYIPQHPGGRPKRMSCSKVTHITQSEVFYQADTSGGSSGSPVLCVQNNDMYVLALHKSGSETLLDGRIANKGILMSCILDHVCGQRGDDERAPNNDGASSKGRHESGAIVQDPTANQTEKTSDLASINNVAKRDPSCVQESGNASSKSSSARVSPSVSPQSAAFPGGPQPCPKEPICTEPFETKELIRIAQRMGAKWPIVAKQTGMFKEWEIDNIMSNISLTSDILKADRMLTDFKARLGTREIIAEAIENSPDLKLAQKVRSGFYIWNVD
ncbi:uncharacterized protein LOC114521615 [Dendronephthya gigantea]|uniref:uncharacterized protein LOC114521615 n=1 Tax=Dendronephthya gigantea TaxID=151771 RepID=UPI00106AFEBC|nr:uncharacterized protein LOC114521615 [Dendronephthya gigantea]